MTTYPMNTILTTVCITTSPTPTPNYGKYYDFNTNRCAPNDDDGPNVLSNILSCILSNDNGYILSNSFVLVHCGSSDDGSNAPAFVNYYNYSDTDNYGASGNRSYGSSHKNYFNNHFTLDPLSLDLSSTNYSEYYLCIIIRIPIPPSISHWSYIRMKYNDRTPPTSTPCARPWTFLWWYESPFCDNNNPVIVARLFF